MRLKGEIDIFQINSLAPITSQDKTTITHPITPVTKNRRARAKRCEL